MVLVGNKRDLTDLANERREEPTEEGAAVLRRGGFHSSEVSGASKMPRLCCVVPY